MPDISILLQVEHSKNGTYGVFPDRAVTKLDITQAGDKRTETVLEVSNTAWTALPLGDIAASNQGVVALKNLDSTNYVEVGYDAGGGTVYTFARLNPLEVCIFRAEPGASLALRSNNAPCKVWAFVLEA